MGILKFLKKKKTESKSSPLRFKITRNDSYLAPFDGAIGKRYDKMSNLKNMLTTGATLSGRVEAGSEFRLMPIMSPRMTIRKSFRLRYGIRLHHLSFNILCQTG